MINFYTGTYLFYNIMAVFAIGNFMRVFFEKRRTTLPVMILIYLLHFVSSAIAFLLINIPVISIIISILTIFLITTIYKSSIMRQFTATAACNLFLIIIELLALLSFGYYQMSMREHLEIENALFFIFTGALIYVISLLFLKVKNIKKISTFFPPMFWISALVISGLSSIGLIITMMYLPQVIAMIFVIIVLGINVLVLYLQDTLSAAYEDKLKAALHTQEKEYYFTQCQLMQESVENIKTIRHDMKLHLAIARDYTARGKANDATDYLDGLLGDIEKKEVYSNTKNTAFDSIINYKLNDAKQENIKLDIRLLIPPALNMEVADVVTILGNLLDNAIEANAKAEDKVIKLDIEYSKESLFIHVENTFDGVVKYAQGKSGAEKIITTRKDSDNHGYGLKNIRNSVEKYNGHVDISHDNNIFSVGVLLYVNEE
ncbi:MAG: GHKL domain-containing protein [Defluviitaleaceae bacterium]|nr:GHKL domain-containing protein [Defluviitaleaceae bacterium]